ncbi:hypothetical protein BDV95DRAFT_518128 [Massariosphaeria phaeospora]|uniref:Six-hairpin glycosidase-like protein n=1 Tax=Massariosphaeria phaeospora TaxID=100035 RepID=A0A7C8MC13_9PLEO|nr:hypothetical protein BDV95DRAFT_518128 [Massariosphaeria phaeospora]
MRLVRMALGTRLVRVFALVLALSPFLASARESDQQPLADPAYTPEKQDDLRSLNPSPYSPDAPHDAAPTSACALTHVATANSPGKLHDAISTMQTEYFALWLGKWTTAVDWTAAVMNTYLTGVLSALSGTSDRSRTLDSEAQKVENEINKYFSQSTTYFFGEDIFAIRNQAFDDMLWVVLGWLDSIKFIEAHTGRHFPRATEQDEGDWHGTQFIPVFSHRARVFYELAEEGWGEKLCGGGMVWNPRLLPYKNAITNELFISASVEMYLHFPGDNNSSPFMVAAKGNEGSSTYDAKFLTNAVAGYDWLKNSNMTNEQGLYVDGFHIKDHAHNRSKTECDERNEMVYSYNQGVVLTGLRGLWEATGNLTYLLDGHELIRNVMHATGWTSSSTSSPITSSTWSGLGADGILTELCDPAGACSQDGQTFKGIFFHHLVAFCAPLPATPVQRGKTFAAGRELRVLHRRSCNGYLKWVVHNAGAAWSTRDEKGRFGAWWGVGGEAGLRDAALLPQGAVDYRNKDPRFAMADGDSHQEPVFRRMSKGPPVHGKGDLNNRGRGRTVETQGGGVAVLRAEREFLRRWGEGEADD